MCVQKVFKRVIVPVIQFENMTFYIEGYPLYLFIWIKFTHTLYPVLFSRFWNTYDQSPSKHRSYMKIWKSRAYMIKAFAIARASFQKGQANPRNLFKLGYKCHEVSSWLSLFVNLSSGREYPLYQCISYTMLSGSP